MGILDTITQVATLGLVDNTNDLIGDIFLTGPLSSLQDQITGGIGDSTRLLGVANADLILAENTEQIRRATLQHEQDLQNIIGIQASSGIVVPDSGSTQAYINEFNSAFAAEVDWANKSANTRAEIARLEDEAQANIAESQATAQGLGIITNIIGILG